MALDTLDITGKKFNCPLCNHETSISFVLENQHCPNCFNPLVPQIHADTKHEYSNFPGLQGIGRLGNTESGNKIHMIRRGQSETVCGKGDIESPPKSIPANIDEYCLSCVYIHETGSYGEGMSDEDRHRLKQRFIRNVDNAVEIPASNVTTRVPDDWSDFGKNKWFDCPGCDSNINVDWLYNGFDCDECGVAIDFSIYYSSQ